jgi:hypothetical protein
LVSLVTLPSTVVSFVPDGCKVIGPIKSLIDLPVDAFIGLTFIKSLK